MKVKFDGNPLAELYDIKEAECKKIDDVQTFRYAFYLHPKAKQEEGDSNLRTKETRILISKSIEINF
jgi:hypothetical protein